MKRYAPLNLTALLASVLLVSCGGGGDAPPPPPEPEETRAQDARTFTAPVEATFAAMAPLPGATQDDIDRLGGTSRWAGQLNGAAYRIEVPAAWNGQLVMYAHGYNGTGTALGLTNPSVRRHLIENGYAWAASSYTTNFYDVRAGVEDTNALALEFNRIAAANSRPLAAPGKMFIIGHSMGGHIAAAAVEDETWATARNKVRYQGAVPMCGVMGDTELFDAFGAMQVTAQALAGVPGYPVERWADVSGMVTSTLFTSFPAVPTAAGVQYLSVVKNLTGGERPLFQEGIAFGGSFPLAYGVFGDAGTINGILNRPVIDTRRFTYVIDGETAASDALNAAVLTLTPDPQANRLRRDGLRWIPKVNGEIRVPVVSIHTLGDLFVPFSMQQIYAQRVAAKGNAANLVQRAIRGASHCDFTVAEQVAAFDDMIAWEAGGPKPGGDDMLTPATVAAPAYGCTYTDNTLGADDSGTTVALRGGIQASLGAGNPCP